MPTLTSKRMAVVAAFLGLVGLAATAAAARPSAGEPASSGGSARSVDFPGAAPWRQVPLSQVAQVCGLNPRLLQKAAPKMALSPYAIIRYGKLCASGGSMKARTETYEVNSAAKTFTALLFGVIATRTTVDENTYVRDWLSQTDQSVDLIATALTRPPLNPDAKIFHLLTQTGHNADLRYGHRVPWFYDAVGTFGMNSLVLLMDKVVKANPQAFPGSKTIRDVARNELFKPLGMTHTDWDGVVASHTLYSNVFDMAKLGELMLRKGRWGDKQIVNEDYIYRMTHPQVEDVHTGYGYLTWLNAAAGVAALFDIKTEPACSPFAGWKRYAHAPTFEAPNDNGGAPFHKNAYDDGVFWADGAGGQFTYVHRGLDLVIVTRDDENAQKSDPESQERGKSNPTGLEYHRTWRLLRPSLIAMDPKYKGNEAAFCKAYREGTYAPDLISGWTRQSGFALAHY
jgi:CubicO group peptidase (beta-lactamase class C family)